MVKPKKEGGGKLKTVAEIDLMLQEIKNTIANLQADKLATAKGARERNALAVLSNIDTKSQNILARRVPLRELKLLTEDLDSAIAAPDHGMS